VPFLRVIKEEYDGESKDRGDLRIPKGMPDGEIVKNRPGLF